MKDLVMTIRLSEKDKKDIECNAKKYGFKSTSEYIRFVAKNCVIDVGVFNERFKEKRNI